MVISKYIYPCKKHTSTETHATANIHTNVYIYSDVCTTWEQADWKPTKYV